MRRRTPGRPYRIDWPEYYVDCAMADCQQYAILTTCGEAETSRIAERLARTRGVADDNGEGWRQRRGLWYCPAHAPLPPDKEAP